MNCGGKGILAKSVKLNLFKVQALAEVFFNMECSGRRLVSVGSDLEHVFDIDGQHHRVLAVKSRGCSGLGRIGAGIRRGSRICPYCT